MFGFGRSTKDPLADKKSAERWFGSFAATDPLGAHSAILTELGAEAAAPYIGRDNRKEGRTAAWLIVKAARRPGKVGIIVGSHRFLCQETAEISFRA